MRASTCPGPRPACIARRAGAETRPIRPSRPLPTRPRPHPRPRGHHDNRTAGMAADDIRPAGKGPRQTMGRRRDRPAGVRNLWRSPARAPGHPRHTGRRHRLPDRADRAPGPARHLRRLHPAPPAGTARQLVAGPGERAGEGGGHHCRPRRRPPGIHRPRHPDLPRHLSPGRHPMSVFSVAAPG